MDEKYDNFVKIETTALPMRMINSVLKMCLISSVMQYFMGSEQFCQLIIDLIDETQNCVDEKYDNFVKIVHDEMKEKLTPLSKGGDENVHHINHIGQMNYLGCGNLLMIRKTFIPDTRGQDGKKTDRGAST